MCQTMLVPLLMVVLAVGPVLPTESGWGEPTEPERWSWGPSSPTPAGHVLMATLLATRSHTVPFAALGGALTQRGHNVTFVSGFPGSGSRWSRELTPPGLVNAVRDFALNFDLLTARVRGEAPVSALDTLRYCLRACRGLLTDPEFTRFLAEPHHFQLLVLDGAFAECAIGLKHRFQAPVVLINTVAMNNLALTDAGNPEPLAVTPFFTAPGYTTEMSLPARLHNAALHLTARALRRLAVSAFIQPVVEQALGPGVPDVLSLQREADFILQNGYPTLTHARPLLPNVAEVGCLHCHAPRPLPQDLERWVSGGTEDAGCVVVSMGSSVRAAAMPDQLRRVFVRAFARLPYRFLWKWEDAGSNLTSSFPEPLPANVKLSPWLPQQDLLGHPGVVGLVSHGGLLSVMEAAFHAKPLLALPVFCDHDVNAAKAQSEGFALTLELRDLTAEALAAAISALITDPSFREHAARHSELLRDQPVSPLERAVFWSEHVMRHRGAEHLKGATRQLSTWQWLYLDAAATLGLLVFVVTILLRASTRSRKLKQH